MKKITIIILSVLLIFSFSSCKKDMSEEVITSYAGFWDVYYRGDPISSLFNGDTLEEKRDSSNNFDITLNTVEIIEQASLEDYWEDYIDTLDSSTSKSLDYEPEDVQGKISGTYKDDSNYTITMTDVAIPYTIKGKSDEVLTTGTLKLSGSFSKEDSTDKTTVKYDFKVNDVSYSAEYSIDAKNNKFTSASFNGTNVDVRLLNANQFGM